MRNVIPKVDVADSPVSGGVATSLKILLNSSSFDPNIGGIEGVSSLLSMEFVRLGHQVKVVTQTSEPSERSFPFEVIRRPSPQKLIRLLDWADLYWQNHVSLLAAWPLLFIHRPWVVTQQTWLSSGAGFNAWTSQALKGRLKRFLLSRFATTVAISKAIAEEVPRTLHIIGNPYDDATFRFMGDAERVNDLIYVGRLVSDKGVQQLLEALALLKRRSYHFHLTVVGIGPEGETLRRVARDLELADQVEFVGSRTGSQLARLLNAHRVLVVPSIWHEPFGIVALEGCACGCAVIGSDSGGLPEAIGPCGVTFPNGDVEALADRIVGLCSDPSQLLRCRSASQAHLVDYTAESVGAAYLRVFESAIKSRGQR